MARRAVVTLLAGGTSLGLLTHPAGADTPTPADRERAISLFDSGRDLMAKGDFAAACPKFAESEALDDQIGTLMNLAYCDEHIDQTAGAWWAWVRAAKEADARGQPKRAVFARDNANRLQPTLLRVSVRLPPSMLAVPVTVTIDGLPLTDLGNPAPIDPGEHELRAEGPGLLPWSTRFAAASDGVPPLLVPALAPDPAAERAGSPQGAATRGSERDPRPRASAPATWILAGTGGAAIGLGAAFGVAAILNENSSNSDRNCLANGNCTQAGLDYRSNERKDATVADVSFAVGAGALVAAAVLWMTSAQRSAPPGRAMIEPVVARGEWSISLNRAW